MKPGTVLKTGEGDLVCRVGALAFYWKAEATRIDLVRVKEDGTVPKPDEVMTLAYVEPYYPEGKNVARDEAPFREFCLFFLAEAAQAPIVEGPQGIGPGPEGVPGPPGGPETPLAPDQRFRVEVATVFADDGEKEVTEETADAPPATYRLVPVSMYGRQPVTGDVLMTAILPAREGGVSEQAMAAAIATSSTWAERTEDEKARYRHRLENLLAAVEPVIRREALAERGIARVAIDDGAEVIDSGKTAGLHIGIPLDGARALLAYFDRAFGEEGATEEDKAALVETLDEVRHFVAVAEQA